MGQIDPLAQLTDARRKDTPWYKLVAALRALEAKSLADEEGRPWVKVAAAASRFTTNQLRQMDRTLSALEALAANNPRLSLAPILALPFSHLELIVRIAKADRETAEKLLSDESGWSRRTYRDLRHRYDEIRSSMTGRASSRSAGQQSRHQFAKTCFELLAVEQNLRDLCGYDPDTDKIRLLKWTGTFQYASPDFVILHRVNGERFVYGVECLLIYGDVHEDGSVREVLKAATEATFFKKYFMFVPPWAPIGVLGQHLSALKLHTVGRVMIDARKLIPLDKPDGAPLPNRQDLLLDNYYISEKFVHLLQKS
ncbi:MULTISPECIES: hypothetical protein [Methylobacterium]|jgi:hypothetical protein|uniref:Uncharacterized protein n=1 Tax=Methylobacterium brachiatum TaxID=269660 RepID=A0AAJ1U020_9HYPH|nr:MULTISPECIES: hypothetical protein [Methylobacterium]EIZ84319.1 hypothetical protein WYO_3200 [Methylobacterium sp. GXF4]MBP28082.1 hypothetical protein [Methylobacterium sp.]MDH2312541.1 hypothetical protein [Methylobacterium brachiatum]MDQ0546812.1 hypothetical protein [Methylobacterium brachiatum]